MNKTVFAFSIIASLASVVAAAPAKPKAFNYAAAIKEVEKTFAKNMPFTQRFEEFGKLLDNPDFKTNVNARIAVLGKQADLCMMPGWTRLKEFDPGMMKRVFPGMMPGILDSAEYSPEQKIPFAGKYVKFLAGEERYDEARKLIRKWMADWKPADQDKARLLLVLVDLEYWADNQDGAFAALKELETIAPDRSYKRGYEYAGQINRPELKDEYLAKMSFAAVASLHFGNGHPTPTPAVIDRAYDFIVNPTNEPVARFNAYQSFLKPFKKDPRRTKAYEIVMALPSNEVVSAWAPQLSTPFSYGDWAEVVENWELANHVEQAKAKPAQRTVTKDQRNRRMYVISLYNLGKKEQAVATAESFAKAEEIPEKDLLKMRYIIAIMRGEKTDAILKGSTLSAKDQSEVVRSAGRDAVAMELSDTAERLSAEYKTFFTAKPERQLTVKYSKDALRGFATWRKLLPTLEKGYTDLPFGANVEALVTDVNTAREITEKTDTETQDIKMELTALCDRYGLHLYLRVADKNAGKVEHGFASGVTTEMYFAPGDNEPYQCFGSNPIKGVTWGMNTTYNNRNSKRIDFTGTTGCGFKSEVEFTDDDYAMHMQFDWGNFYQKLPVDGKEWKFDCIAWTPQGGKTWGGSRGIHHSSDWGRLRFSLSEAEIREIKRELILSSYKSWRVPKSPEGERTLDVFDAWADPVIGDPAFYEKCLKPMEEELAGYVKLVKPDMPDDTVDLVFEKALPKWLGIRHEIDHLRKWYLSDAYAD